MNETSRLADHLRPVRLQRGVLPQAEGSALMALGNTVVLCTASVLENVPPHRKGTGLGWVTAEYAMLPRATATRSDRDSARGRPNGRSQEIQRLIGRSLRAAVDVAVLGERQIVVDCDVLSADGGTRCAAITAGWVALYEAGSWLVARGLCASHPVVRQIAAVSVGVVAGQRRLDLDYALDSSCDADVNVVMDAAGALIEVQGTAEQAPFDRAMLARLLDLAAGGIAPLTEAQRQALAAPAAGLAAIGGWAGTSA